MLFYVYKLILAPDYNSEQKVRTRGAKKQCYISKDNLLRFIEINKNEYLNSSKYRTNILRQNSTNRDYLSNIYGDNDYFTIDLSLSQGRIYIGSSSDAWNIGIRGIALPRMTQVIIKNINNGDILFELI